MTFEYRDNTTCDKFVAQPDTDDDRKPVVFLSTTGLNNGVYVPLDHVEEVVAGIRDTARTASGQQPETPACGNCEHPEKLHGRGGCWGHWGPDEGCTCAWTGAVPAVGQPAEAQAAVETLLTAAERKFLHFALDEAAEEMSYGDGFTDEDQAALDRLRLLAGKDER